MVEIHNGLMAWIFECSPASGTTTADHLLGMNGTTSYLNANGGRVGIGTKNPDKALTVKGAIHASEVIVDNTIVTNELKVKPVAWADGVFDEKYQITPISELEQHIKATKHLPGIPSAREVAENGVSVGDMQAKLLATIEELTLRVIEQEKRINRLEAERAAERNSR